MTHKNIILAVDLGTTGNRAIAFSKTLTPLASHYVPFKQYFPKPAWVEHDPIEIWTSTKLAIETVIQQIGVDNIRCIGLTNQRETTVVWNKETGIPIHPAIVWQCRRTADICAALSDHHNTIRDKTGLICDAYYSASKIQWILDNVPNARSLAEKGDLLFGTIDTWILWQLSGQTVHKTDPSNASRSMLYNIHTHDYDETLLNIFQIPHQLLPKVQSSTSIFAETPTPLFGKSIPITGILGDQQAALFAQGGWQQNTIKSTYGTGLFIITNTKDKTPKVGKLVNTIAWDIDGQIDYALEGSIFVGGSAIQWLRDGINIIDDAAETEALAQSLASNEDVYFVPALVGLGAPYWDPNARGLFIGLTRGTSRAHMVRATLESMAYQVSDIIEEIKTHSTLKCDLLRVDGGATSNNFLMQFQADILDTKVERPSIIETTAMGTAGIAGLTTDIWSKEDFLSYRQIEQTFKPKMNAETRQQNIQKWKSAVSRSLSFATPS